MFVNNIAQSSWTFFSSALNENTHELHVQSVWSRNTDRTLIILQTLIGLQSLGEQSVGRTYIEKRYLKPLHPNEAVGKKGKSV
jgi:hypothetical protein